MIVILQRKLDILSGSANSTHPEMTDSFHYGVKSKTGYWYHHTRNQVATTGMPMKCRSPLTSAHAHARRLKQVRDKGISKPPDPAMHLIIS